MKKFTIPKTYEEALARKKEVLALINAYNEAILNDLPPTLSDEEIDALQEEYQVLNDLVIEKVDEDHDEFITEEKFLDEGIVVEEKVRKRSFLDEVNPLIYVYMIIVFLFSSWFILSGIGFDLLTWTFSWGNQTVAQYQEYAKILIWLRVLAPFIVFPLALIGLNFIVRLFFRKKQEERKLFWWYILVHGIFVLINFTVIYFTEIKKFYDMFIDTIFK